MKNRKMSPAERAYAAFCCYRNRPATLPLPRCWNAAWGALAGAAAAGASTPTAYAAYRAAAGAAGAGAVPSLSELNDGELRGMRAACQAVRP